jgi:iron complex transport system permease protein
MKNRRLPMFVILSALFLAVLFSAPFVGATAISFSRALDLSGVEEEPNIDAMIFFGVRLPRVVFGLLAGGALALAGAVFQSLLRNDLADPYTLGVSGGAAMGALLSMSLLPAALLPALLPIVTFAMAAGSVFLIESVARWRGTGYSQARLILAGVTLNMLYGAAILLIQYLSDPYQTLSMIRWMMGGLDVSSWRTIVLCAAILLPTALFILSRGRALNVLSLGDQTAHALGVETGAARRNLLLASSLLAATIVAYAGPVGFVGLMVPHIMRLLLGPDNRTLLPACALAGGPFLVLCDTLGRSVMGSVELPVGIITSLLGAPFFFWLLFRRTS